MIKKAYKIINQTLRIALLWIWWGFYAIVSKTGRRRAGRSKDVIIVQFAPRPGFTGGDVVANSLIRQSLETNGYHVETISVSPDRRGNIVLDWLLEGKWRLFRSARTKIKNRRATIIIDAQLNLGFFNNPCINVFHYSFIGYKRLTGAKWLVEQKLASTANSLIQSIGSMRSVNVAVSPFQSRFLKREGVHVDKIIPNSIDIELFKPVAAVQKKGDFVYVGASIYFAKGLDVLERLADKGLKIDCVMPSKGNGTLNCLGSRPHGEIPELLQEYKALIHPSRYESCSMCVLEAMASGLPVLVSNVGIGPELRKEIPEFVVAGYDDEAISEYIRKAELILGDYPRYSRLARNYVERFHSFNGFQTEWAALCVGKVR